MVRWQAFYPALELCEFIPGRELIVLTRVYIHAWEEMLTVVQGGMDFVMNVKLERVAL